MAAAISTQLSPFVESILAKPYNVRHVAIWQIVESKTYIPQKCFENDMADIYFKRHSNKNFNRLVQEYDNNPNDYNSKFKKMKKEIWRNLLVGPVPPRRITLYLFVAFL